MREYRIVSRPQITLCDVDYYVDVGNGEPYNDRYFDTEVEAFDYSIEIMQENPTIGNAPVMERVTPVSIYDNENVD